MRGHDRPVGGVAAGGVAAPGGPPTTVSAPASTRPGGFAKVAGHRVTWRRLHSHYTRRDARLERLSGEDWLGRASGHRSDAQGAPDVDPVREPRPTPGPASVAGGGGHRAQARDRTPRRLLLRAEPTAEGGPRSARRGGGDVPGTHAPGHEAGRL